MTRANKKFLSDLKFLDLLLQQFGGHEGELTMAIAYLTQAVSDDDPARKATLVRIARRKIRHADILGAILLHLAKGRSGPLPKNMDRAELADFLKGKGFTINYYDKASLSLEKLSIAENPTGAGTRYSSSPRAYLTADILSEDVQIKAYEDLISLTSEPAYISALNYARETQVQHRKDLIDLRDRIADGH